MVVHPFIPVAHGLRGLAILFLLQKATDRPMIDRLRHEFATVVETIEVLAYLLLADAVAFGLLSLINQARLAEVADR